MWFHSFIRRQSLLIFVWINILGAALLVFFFNIKSWSVSLSHVISDGNISFCPVQGKVLFRNRNCDLDSPKGLLYKQPGITLGRCDVVAVTPWLAPIVWEGTFDPVLLDAIYKPKNLTIATTVFAIGKYIRFLRDFLETAEKHFMVGFKVHYHIFTDQSHKVPSVNLAAGRKIFVHQVPKSNCWQDISALRMQMIQTIIEEQVHREADYIYCQDVDAKFHFRWGAETLDRLVAQTHPWFYDKARYQFTYERRPESKAYIPPGEGDFYYIGAMFGGTVEEVYKLVKMCHENLKADKANGIEAVWQEESHLNWYLLYNKPSKILSPEYLWNDNKGKTNVLKVVRLSHVLKKVRENA